MSGATSLDYVTKLKKRASDRAEKEQEEIASGEKNYLNAHTESSNMFFLNGIKARSSKVIEIPVFLQDPAELKGMYLNFNGFLETTVEYRKYASAASTSNKLLAFKPLSVGNDEEPKDEGETKWFVKHRHELV